MAKDFSKSTGATALKAVAKKSNETANASFIIWVSDADLEDYSENEEMGFSLDTTEDLEIAIEQNGFTDPLEVIPLPYGKYEIRSGHRRRLAGRNMGMTSFPVIVKEDLGTIRNRRAVLEANFRREMTPMQYAKLIAAWEEQLKRENMKGDKRRYISKVLNLSEAQISRYNSLNKMITPLQELVDSGKIGLSSVSSIAKYTKEEQEEILILFSQFLGSYDNVPDEDKYDLLTRDKAKELLDAYEDGIKDYDELQVKGQMNIDDDEYLSFHPDPDHSITTDTFSYPDHEPDSSSAPIQIYELDGEPYGATYNQIIVSLISEMNEYQFSTDLIDGDRCNAFGKDYFAYNVNNDGYITIEDENEKELFKVSIERFQSEYDFHVANLSIKKPEKITPEIEKRSNWKEGGHKEIISSEPDPVETVEVDIIHTLSTETKSPDTLIPSHLELAREMLKQKQERLREFINVQSDAYADRKYIESRKVEVGALAAYIADLEEIPEPVKSVQPELPLLRNNDQRKEFIDNYSSWPIWIDLNETGERYYRYNLTDKVAMVVKVSKQHIWRNYKQTEEIGFGHEEYYLLGIRTGYGTGTVFTEDDTRTFYECSSNKSALVDYLKEFQK